MIKESYVRKMAEIELAQAKVEHEEKFHSEHEAESVLREEIEETSEAASDMVITYADLWAAVRDNDSNRQGESIKELKKRAFLVVAEAVQVYAMCIKWEKSFCEVSREKRKSDDCVSRVTAEDFEYAIKMAALNIRNYEA